MTVKKPETEAEAAAPALHFTQTPEFLAAVEAGSAATIAAAKASMLAEVAPLMAAMKHAQGAGAVDGDIMSNMRQLAMAIAEISDQDQGRKRTPPAELAARAKARAEMDAAILKHRGKGESYMAMTGTKDAGPDAPLYMAIGKSYLDEMLIQPFEVDPATKKPYPVTFVWFGVPNEAMRPANDAAKEVFGFFKRSIGDDPSDAPAPPGPGWISAGGLVIQGMHGTPISRRAPDPESYATDLHIRGPGQFDPRRDRINILGTVAEPARHIAADGQAPRKGI